MTRQLKVGDKVKRLYPNDSRFMVGSIHIVDTINKGLYAGQAFTVKGFPDWVCVLNEDYWQLIEEETDMKLGDLEVGMRLELRDGTQCLVVKCGVKLSLLNDKSYAFEPRTWNDDLTSVVNGRTRDIVKVWDDNHISHVSADLSKSPTTATIWTRKESKDVDVEEAMQVLKGHYGCDVKLVGG